jgi:hypothetical protein
LNLVGVATGIQTEELRNASHLRYGYTNFPVNSALGLRPKSAGNERENEGRKGGMIKINEK